MSQRPSSLFISIFFLSFSLVLFELLLTRIFAIVLFAQFAHLALALALLGISIGAIAQHLYPTILPDNGLEKRVAFLCLGQAVTSFVAIYCALHFPVIEQFDVAPTTLGERSSVKDNLLNPFWFSALLPVLTIPFGIAGLAFAGIFQRRAQWISKLYGYDLIGGAIGAILFVPALNILAGPDVIFVICSTSVIGALVLFQESQQRMWQRISQLALILTTIAILSSAFGYGVLKIQYSAGYSEENISHTEWTALARISIHTDDKRGSLILLDNTSASEVFETQKKRQQTATTFVNRSLVYQLHKPPGHVAVLAASAGPEVAIAQHFGFSDIEAIDIAGEIFDIVADHFPNSPVNPYLFGNTKRVKSDGRAAILHGKEPYDIIQMVHANLWSSAGLLSNSWSPSLLETKEAFHTYLDNLTEDGTISFGRGTHTLAIARAATAALQERGVEDPWRYIFYGTAGRAILLVKKRPWTQEERDLAVSLLKQYKKPKVLLDPFSPDVANSKKQLLHGGVMTDDRPYLDDPSMIWKHVAKAFSVSTNSNKPMAILYRSIVIQTLFVLLAGLAFLLLPFLRRGPTRLHQTNGVAVGLLYVSCLGYGYLAIETVLIHELVLFVGHPTYAVTCTVLAMLLFSGLGAMWTARVSKEHRESTLKKVLMSILFLGIIQCVAVPALLYRFALGWPLFLRLFTTFFQFSNQCKSEGVESQCNNKSKGIAKNS